MTKKLLCLLLSGLWLVACAATEKNQTIAQKLQQKCGTGDFDACNDFGYLNEYGMGISVNKKAAFELYQKSCEGNSAQGCNNLGRYYAFGTDGIIKINLDKSVELFEKACSLGDQTACSNLNILRLQRNARQPSVE